MDNLGERVRMLRNELGKSQRALARDAGVSNGTISLIESGQSDPTVGQLKKILGALDISMVQFFEGGHEPTEQYFYSASELVEIGSGKISYKHVHDPRKTRQLQILSEVYEPGADTGPSMLRHDGEEGGVIISGELEVQVLGKKRRLKAGDAYQFPSHLPHRFRNTGKSRCRLISACTPPSF
ncbi:MAG: cupin domain-containing protein [Pseudomonadota bacterium]